MAYRRGKVDASIRKLAAEFLERRLTGPALVTVTGSETSEEAGRIKIFFTVYPSEEEKKILDFLNRSRNDFKKFIKNKLQIRSIPYIEFEIDRGERARQRLEEILRQKQKE